MRLGGMPPEILERRATWRDHHVALAITFWWWADHRNLGSNVIPRYLYLSVVVTVWVTFEPSGFFLVSWRSGGGYHGWNKGSS